MPQGVLRISRTHVVTTHTPLASPYGARQSRTGVPWLYDSGVRYMRRTSTPWTHQACACHSFENEKYQAQLTWFLFLVSSQNISFVFQLCYANPS